MSACYFSTIDLRSGYWQIPVEPSDAHKTAFSFGAEYGLFEFKVLPFGLTEAPVTFQRLMNSLFSDMPFVCVYLDDIIVFSRSKDEHWHHSEAVFRALADARLTVNSDKSVFSLEEISYLGYIFDRNGMRTDPAKTNVIIDYPIPTCVKDVQKFLGIANYYRRFIKNFAGIARPLHNIVKKNDTFVFTEECLKAFNELKKCLVSPPTLSYPDSRINFSVSTDASNKAVGAVLEQNGKAISFASRALSPTECKFSTYELECLAIVYALKQFRQYLLGKKFQLFSDHEPLKWLLNNKSRNGRVGRWVMQLQEFDFDIIYRKGSENSRSDFLYRLCS
ncbi:Retrovirus-related Pol polyprotein from transposon 17.6 [Thelohanellus kitauei]|uniref:Retrovirus-related Pol polyprotein from transposon 17.6 n=1 Tax=Thelohanellus kitauei TaxID=669202 RepID=A0A0C2JLP0_THEKT|nr:Retrovirus-related Pol polyprotein from transposon 17.6 [Thelohanellus kitauei]